MCVNNKKIIKGKEGKANINKIKKEITGVESGFKYLFYKITYKVYNYVYIHVMCSFFYSTLVLLKCNNDSNVNFIKQEQLCMF